MKKDLLSITDLTKPELLDLLKLAIKVKGQIPDQQVDYTSILRNKTMVMIFEKPSLRTKVSFEIAMNQLGGQALYLGPGEIQMGVRESVKDIACVVAGMADIMMARVFKHEVIIELAANSAVPVINGLSDLEHPCQILADLLTILELKGDFCKLKLAYLGDGENNVTHSLLLAGGLLGMDIAVACPKGYAPDAWIVKNALKLAHSSGAQLEISQDVKAIVQNADIIYTDTWVSMGDEQSKVQRVRDLQPYQVTPEVMCEAKKDAIFMHDMPALSLIHI